MKINQEEYLKEIEKDVVFNSDKCMGRFLTYYSLIIGQIFFYPSIYLLLEQGITSFLKPSFLLLALFLSFFCIVGGLSSLKASLAIKKKYGSNFEEKVIKKIEENVDIEEIKKYYEKSSDSFKFYILNPIIEKEIKNHLGIDKYSKLDLLNKMREEDKIEVINT